MKKITTSELQNITNKEILSIINKSLGVSYSIDIDITPEITRALKGTLFSPWGFTLPNNPQDYPKVITEATEKYWGLQPTKVEDQGRVIFQDVKLPPDAFVGYVVNSSVYLEDNTVTVRSLAIHKQSWENYISGTQEIDPEAYDDSPEDADLYQDEFEDMREDPSEFEDIRGEEE